MKDIKELKPLIDCDILLYRCGFAADAQVRRDIVEKTDGIPEEDIQEILLETDYVNYALGNVKTTMADILGTFAVKDDYYRAFLTGSGNFREQVATLLPYKGNRKDTHKPKYYKEIKDYLRGTWGALVIDGREADDALATEQCQADSEHPTCIVTTDKDLDMVPGYHYNWVKQQFYFLDDEQADKFLFYQMLTGDRVDNIPGIKNVGPVRAEKLLDGTTLDDAREVVKDQYRKQYGEGWEAAYYEVARLLWMERELGKECPYL